MISDHAKSLVKNLSILKSFKNLTEESKLLQSMKDLKYKTSLGSDVEVLTFENEITECAYAPKSLFIRKWYKSFYDVVRQNKTSVIISNPGYIFIIHLIY